MEADTEAPVLEGQRAAAPEVLEEVGDNATDAQPDMQAVETAPLLQDRRRPKSNP